MRAWKIARAIGAFIFARVRRVHTVNCSLGARVHVRACTSLRPARVHARVSHGCLCK